MPTYQPVRIGGTSSLQKLRFCRCRRLLGTVPRTQAGLTNISGVVGRAITRQLLKSAMEICSTGTTILQCGRASVDCRCGYHQPPSSSRFLIPEAHIISPKFIYQFSYAYSSIPNYDASAAHNVGCQLHRIMPNAGVDAIDGRLEKSEKQIGHWSRNCGECLLAAAVLRCAARQG